jgi:DNA-binding NarL/FixJ family response regulator
LFIVAEMPLMSLSMLRVVIADDHPMIIQGIRAGFLYHSHIQVVGSTKTFLELFEFLAATVVDVVILDLVGMKSSPLITVERLRRLYPQLGIVVFSSTFELAPELLEHGVHGYISKEDRTDQLPLAIEAASRGERILSPEVRTYLQQILALQSRERLANKELSVLKLLAQGMSTVEIADEMGIDPRSVQNYVTALRRKTGCSTRNALAEWYRRNISAQE